RFILLFFFFFSVVSLSWRAFSIQCKMGWQEWNQACYKLSKDFKPFSNASSICRQSGAELVSIASLQENEFVHNISEGEDVFIGLRAAKANDSFVWLDGSTFDYTRWEDGEPNETNGDCVVDGCCVILVEPTGRWNDTPCEMWYPFVCKFTSSQPKLRPDKNALKKEQNFIIHEQKSLAHHVIYKQSLSSLIHCALICTNWPFCKSVNFISEQGGNFGECQLNDATAEDFPFHLMRVSNSVYSVVYSS
ncbi:unnamed protein product, partial [Porites lobata]